MTEPRPSKPTEQFAFEAVMRQAESVLNAYQCGRYHWQVASQQLLAAIKPLERDP